MKIEMRVDGSGARPPWPDSSVGGRTWAIIVTMPSAGAMISPSPFGVVRIGSRKKAATHKVRPASGQASVSHALSAQTRHKAKVTTTNLRPSGCTLGIR